MANLHDDSEEGVSLFPMFNILACTLGVMVFILATVATVSLGADKAVELVAVDAPDSPAARQPLWLEWDGEVLSVHPGRDQVRFDQDLRSLPTFEQTHRYMLERLSGTRLGGRLARAAQLRDRSVVVLVRPSGFRNLAEIRSYLDLLGLDSVQEPIDADWQRIQVR